MAVNDTDELVATARLRGIIPVNAGSWTTAALLNEARRQLLNHHLPLLINARGEFLVKSQNVSMVASQEAYRLSHRAAAIRHVAFMGTDQVLRPTTEMNPEEQAQWYAQPSRVGTPQFYSFSEQYLKLWPIPQTNETIRVKWHIRPSRLVSFTTDAAVITAKSTVGSSTTLTVAANPPASATVWSAGTKNDAGTKMYDLIKRSSPFDAIGYDLIPTSTTATTLVFTATDVPSDIGIGDIICPAQYSGYPMVPEELHHALALRTAAAFLASKGDNLANDFIKEADEAESNLLKGILEPRSKGNVKRLSSRRW